MKTRILILMVFALAIAFSFPVCAQSVNYAPTGTPSHANQQAGENNYLVWTWHDNQLNDGFTSDVAHGVVVSHQARYSTWASFDSIITFSTPIAQLDRIEAVLGQYGGNQVSQLIAYIDTGSGWRQVGDTGYFAPPTRPYTQVFDTGAPWNNVRRIKVYSYSLTAGWAYVDYRLFEIRAWGPSRPSYQDIGLRVYHNGEVVSIAGEPPGSVTSPLRISKGGTTYGIALIDTSEPEYNNPLYDSGVRVKLSSGVKALRRL